MNLAQQTSLSPLPQVPVTSGGQMPSMPESWQNNYQNNSSTTPFSVHSQIPPGQATELSAKIPSAQVVEVSKPGSIASQAQSSQTAKKSATIPSVSTPLAYKQSLLNQSHQQKPVKIVVTLPTSAYFTSGLRELSLTLAKNMSGFSDQWAYRFQSIVDELVNNAIEFGSKPGESIEIVFVSVMSQYIEVFVKDGGTGTAGKTASEIVAFIEERKGPGRETMMTGIRGRGLAQIVANWADVMDFTDNAEGGITAHVVKRFQKDDEFVIPI